MEEKLIYVNELKNQIEDSDNETQLTINLLIDTDTDKEEEAAKLIQGKDEARLFSIRHTLLLAQKSHNYKYTCAYCGEPVRLICRRLYDKKKKETWFFAHFKGNNGVDCPIKTETKQESTSEADEKWSISTFAESELHKDLINRLMEILKNSSFHNTRWRN